MAFEDQLVARARRHLDDYEGLVASLVGVEADGRRRRIVLVTERRLIVAWARPAPPVVLPLHEVTVIFDVHTGRLALSSGDTTIELRAVDAPEARQVVRSIENRTVPPLRDRITQPQHVRIVSTG